MGSPKIINDKSRAVSFSSVKKPPGLRNFTGAEIKSLRGKKFVEIGKKPSFGTLASLIGMNGLVILHENITQVSPKDEVDILTLYPDDVEELDSELSCRAGSRPARQHPGGIVRREIKQRQNNAYRESYQGTLCQGLQGRLHQARRPPF